MKSLFMGSTGTDDLWKLKIMETISRDIYRCKCATTRLSAR